MKRTNILLLFVVATALLSCRHETDLTNVPVVHFSTEIQTILSSNCTMSGCHDGNSEFSLIGYENLMSNGSVKAGNAHDSKLYLSVTGREEMMPPASNPSLTNTQLQQIYVWIEQGALNN